MARSPTATSAWLRCAPPWRAQTAAPACRCARWRGLSRPGHAQSAGSASVHAAAGRCTHAPARSPACAPGAMHGSAAWPPPEPRSHAHPMQAYIVPTEDPHMSEYPPARFQRREFISRCGRPPRGPHPSQRTHARVRAARRCRTGSWRTARLPLVAYTKLLRRRAPQVHRLGRHRSGDHRQGAAVDGWPLLSAGAFGRPSSWPTAGARSSARQPRQAASLCSLPCTPQRRLQAAPRTEPRMSRT